MSRSYPQRHGYHHKPQSNANPPPRFRKSMEQNTRRGSHDSHGPSDEYHQNNSSYTSTNRNEENVHLREKLSATERQRRYLRQHSWRHTDTYYRKNYETYDEQKVNDTEGDSSQISSQNSDTREEIPGRSSDVTAIAHTDHNLASGSVINGRYVRRTVTQSTSQLNAEAPPFIPKTTFGHSGKDRNIHSSSLAKQKYNNNRKPMREPHSGHGSSQENNLNTRHSKTVYFNRGSSRPKSYKGSTRKNSGVSSDIALGSELCAEDLEYDEWDPDIQVAGGSKGVNHQMGEKVKAINIPKNKESTTQRERLISQLEKGECECLVCCEPMRVRDYVWSCSNCYHVFHLRCIKKWARSPTAVDKDGSWRCPACQSINKEVPHSYYCFCGKCKDPEVNFHFTPHSCGEVCSKRRADEQCTHLCNILCHPGPCPPCTATVVRTCSCGKLQNSVPCARNEPLTCSSVCGKLLNCGIHTCGKICHVDECEPCSVIVTQECYCSREERNVQCTSSSVSTSNYSCGMACDKMLQCGNHLCPAICHDGPCVMCSLLPDVVTACPCGKTPLKEMLSNNKAVIRRSCIDPVPVCDNKCEKILLCGPKNNPHKCESKCHTGDCPSCDLTTTVKCRCGATHKEMPCVEMLNSPFLFQCEKRCNRRKDCGRHKCLNNCCINAVHKCELVCSRKLSCGSHHCQETCHAGNCHTCWNVSFDELRCQCGHSVMYPPVPCGTKPPECNQPCARSHPCDHKVQHTCHSDENCPPCTLLTVKWCFGHHERRSNVQCFLDGISCGKHCNKPLPCDRHKCLEVCHSGSCLKPNTLCIQPCGKLRTCGHPCSAPCHEGDCPDSVCKAKVEVSCPCGQRCETITCSEDSNAYRLMSVSILASKIQDIKAGESVNIGDIFSKKGKTSRLQCNEACALYDRNKRLAVALQIQNPDLSCKPGPPSYSEFLKEEAKKNLKFVSGVYDKISELVQLAKQSKQKSRSYAFPTMKRDQRRVVHELAEFFGCETQSYDEEPVKNVVITAFRDKSWLPFVSIATVVERDMGLRRGPTPIVSLSTPKTPTQASTVEKKEKVIDYFDYTG